MFTTFLLMRMYEEHKKMNFKLTKVFRCTISLWGYVLLHQSSLLVFLLCLFVFPVFLCVEIWKLNNVFQFYTVLNSINRACTFVRSIQWINLSNNICSFYLQKVQDMKPTYPNKFFRANIDKNAFQKILPCTSCLLLYIIHSLIWWWSVVIRLPLV
jgi:hypothetical protein